MSIPELLAERHKLSLEAEILTWSAVSEDRGMSPVEIARFDVIMREANEITAAIEQQKALSSAAGRLLGQ